MKRRLFQKKATVSEAVGFFLIGCLIATIPISGVAYVYSRIISKDDNSIVNTCVPFRMYVDDNSADHRYLSTKPKKDDEIGGQLTISNGPPMRAMFTLNLDLSWTVPDADTMAAIANNSGNVYDLGQQCIAQQLLKHYYDIRINHDPNINHCNPTGVSDGSLRTALTWIINHDPIIRKCRPFISAGIPEPG